MGVALTIILTAICGCMTAKHQGMLNYVFGVFLLVITVILFVITGVVNGVTNLSEDTIQDACAGETDIPNTEYIASIDDFQNQWVG